MRRSLLVLCGTACLALATPALASPTPVPTTSLTVTGPSALSAAATQDWSPEVTRVAGADRYATAAAAAQAWSPGVGTVYVVGAAGYQDAALASSRAGAQGGPVLLTRKDAAPAVTLQALQRLQPNRVVVVGGWSVVSDAVVQQLQAHSVEPVVRVAGANAYETSADLAALYPAGPSRVYLASGADFPDALTVAALAGSRQEPLLLTDGATVHPDVAIQLARLSPDEVVVLGGPSVVTDAAAQQAGAAAGASVVRVAGDDRYATAADLADYFPASSTVYLASGENFPDALVGAALAARTDSPLLLTRQDALPGATGGVLLEREPDAVTALGGPVAISGPTLSEVSDLVPPDDEGEVPGWGAPSWRDEFGGTSVDSAIWTVRDHSTHGNLSYDQGFIEHESVTVSDGQLRIRATELPEPVVADGQTRWWSTGYLDSIGKRQAQYGRWEIRAKLPTTEGDSRGVWPAFWLRNGDAGEIDILESWGDEPVRDRPADLTETSTLTVHESTNGGGDSMGLTYEHQAYPGEAPYDSASRYRTWTIEYTPAYLKGYLDGELAVHIVPTGELVSGRQQDMSWVWGPTFVQDPWAMRLNLQMGDPYWSPNISPSDLTVMPADLLVDYVRYWDLP